MLLKFMFRYFLQFLWLLVKALLSTFIVISLIIFYAYKVEPAWIEVTEQPVYIEDLPKNFEGFRMVQLSDLHGKDFSHNSLVAQVNRLNPSLVAITGDVFDDEKEIPLSYAAKALRGLRAKYGNYFVFGNNDNYLEDAKVNRELEKLKIKPLVDDGVLIDVKGENIFLGGTKDSHEDKVDLKKLVGKAKTSTIILLSHSPEIINEAAKAEVDLVLVGHTHGGQIKIPYVPRVITFVKKGYEQYVAGLYQVGNTQMYVNRGLGVTKIPMRFLVRPEITVITLHRK